MDLGTVWTTVHINDVRNEYVCFFLVNRALLYFLGIRYSIMSRPDRSVIVIVKTKTFFFYISNIKNAKYIFLLEQFNPFTRNEL